MSSRVWYKNLTNAMKYRDYERCVTSAQECPHTWRFFASNNIVNINFIFKWANNFFPRNWTKYFIELLSFRLTRLLLTNQSGKKFSLLNAKETILNLHFWRIIHMTGGGVLAEMAALTFMTTQLQPTILRALPSLSILHKPAHSPSFLLSSTWV